MGGCTRFLELNDYKLGNLKQQKVTLSELWKSEVQNQGVGRAMLSQKALAENPSLVLPASYAFWGYLVSGNLTHISASVFRWPSSLCVSESESSPPSSIKTLVIGFRTHPQPV